MYSIKDLERISGVKAHTLRIWEKRYDILQPQRTDTNIRLYDSKQVSKLLNIVFLLDRKYKISHISKLSPSELKDTVETLALEFAFISDEKDINDLLHCALEFDQSGFEQKLSHVILKNGFTKTMIDIIYPLLRKIGLLWQIDKLNPAQEHFTSYIIIQKLYTAIDGILYNQSADIKMVLFLIEDEYHEIPLLFANYLLRSNKIQTTYLGPDVPIQNVLSTIETVQPHFFVSFIHQSMNNQRVIEYFETILTKFKKIKGIIGTYPGLDLRLKQIDRITKTENVKHFVELAQNKEKLLST